MQNLPHPPIDSTQDFPHRPLRPEHRRRRGMALIIVMVIVTLVALAAYGLNHQMTDAYRLSQLQIERAQARLTAESGIEAMLVTLQLPRAQRLGWHRGPAESFAAVELEPDADAFDSLSGVADSGWVFSVIAPSGSDNQVDQDRIGSEAQKTWRFGLVNESTKLNLRALGEWDQVAPGQARMALMNLPGATPEMVRALMEAYQIPDSGGAGQRGLRERLQSRQENEAATDDSPGQRWAWAYTGGDWNHNYQIDPVEEALLQRQKTGNLPHAAGVDTGSNLTDQADGELFMQSVSDSYGDSAQVAPIAWRDFLTTQSVVRNENRVGQPRIFLNGTDLQQLHQQLMAIWTPEQANFVIAARQFGMRQSGAGRIPTTARQRERISASEWAPDLAQNGRIRLQSPLDLIGAQVRVPNPNRSSSRREYLTLDNPFSDDFGARSDYLVKLVDDVTVNPSSTIAGQIDLLEAPREVLLGIPSMTAEMASRILDRRNTGGSVEGARETVAWLVAEDVIDLPALKQLLPWITTGGDCYHAQIVAFRDTQSPIFRCTVVLDGSASRPTVRDFQRWDVWGRGFSLTELRGDSYATRN